MVRVREAPSSTLKKLGREDVTTAPKIAGTPMLKIASQKDIANSIQNYLKCAIEANPEFMRTFEIDNNKIDIDLGKLNSLIKIK